MSDNMKKSLLSAQVDLSKFSFQDFEKATEEEKRQQDVMGESTTFFRDGMRRLRKNPLAMGAIIVLVLIILTIFLAPAIIPYGYADIVKGSSNLGPFEYSSSEMARIAKGESVFPHIFGTDSLGRDYFIRVVYGARVSLGVGIFASILVLIIGMLWGSISGYMGGTVDIIMMRIVDIIYSLPDMLLIILLAVVLNETLTPVIKGTSGILVLNAAEAKKGQRTACLQCGRCLKACPIGLQPTKLFKKINSGKYADALKLNLMDCKECGCCAFVCPANIPLVQGFRLGKRMAPKPPKKG